MVRTTSVHVSELCLYRGFALGKCDQGDRAPFPLNFLSQVTVFHQKRQLSAFFISSKSSVNGFNSRYLKPKCWGFPSSSLHYYRIETLSKSRRLRILNPRPLLQLTSIAKYPYRRDKLKRPDKLLQASRIKKIIIRIRAEIKEIDNGKTKEKNQWNQKLIFEKIKKIDRPLPT